MEENYYYYYIFALTLIIISLLIAYTAILFSLKFFYSLLFYVKIISYQLGLLSIAATAVFPSLFSPKDPKNALIASWLFQNTVQRWSNFKVHVKGAEQVDRTKTCIFVCNHQSFLDMYVMLATWPYVSPCVTVAKKEFMYMGALGLYLWLIGTVFIDRSKSKESLDQLNKTIEDLKKRKVRLWIYPEGTRNSDEKLLPFKKGAFHIAVKAQIPVVPVVYSSYSSFYSKKTKTMKAPDVQVQFLPAIPTEGLTSEDIPELIKKVRNSMIERLDAFKED